MHYPWLHLGFYHYVLSSYALKSIEFSDEKKKMKKNLHNKQKGMLKDTRQRASLLAQW